MLFKGKWVYQMHRKKFTSIYSACYFHMRWARIAYFLSEKGFCISLRAQTMLKADDSGKLAYHRIDSSKQI